MQVYEVVVPTVLVLVLLLHERSSWLSILFIYYLLLFIDLLIGLYSNYLLHQCPDNVPSLIPYRICRMTSLQIIMVNYFIYLLLIIIY